jgi:hypothetical protein
VLFSQIEFHVGPTRCETSYGPLVTSRCLTIAMFNFFTNTSESTLLGARVILWLNFATST